MREDVQKMLAQEEMTDFHKVILQDTKQLLLFSRRKMSTFYPTWDHHNDVFEGKVTPDDPDLQARLRKEPEKLIVPLTYSQIMAFVAFAFSTIFQKDKFFELMPMTEESVEPAKVGESLLSRDLMYNNVEAKMFQYFLDIARFGLGVFKIGWTKELETVVQQQPMIQPGSAIGTFAPMMQEVKQTVTKYLGNKIWNISPYRFYPDTRVPLYRFQDGEFVASEDVHTLIQLYEMQRNGEVAGVDFIKPVTKATLDERGPNRLPDDISKQETETSMKAGQSPGTCILTECQRALIPCKYKIFGDKLLGEEDYPVKYNIWYVNDQRVIKCEPLNYLHNQFCYTLGQYTPDINKLLGRALSDSIDALQSATSWFINSRITSVRKVIGDKLVVDPEGIEMKDLQERRPVIRLKPTAGGRGIDRFVKQLNVQDVTASHIGDAKYLSDIAQQTTGITDNLMGQFYTGRRSAREASNVGSSAAARIRMIILLSFRAGIEPMGRQMLSNLRDGLDEETFVRMLGPFPAVQGIQFIKASKQNLLGDYDFEVFDGTLPSERSATSSVLEEILKGILTQPTAAIALQMDPKALMREIFYLRGIRSPERFMLNVPPQIPGAQNGQPGQTQPPGVAGQGVPPSPDIPPGPPSVQMAGRGIGPGTFSSLLSSNTQ